MMKPSWPNGKKDVDQVQAELLPLAQGQRAVDDLPAAEVEHGGLAQVGDQEDDREQEARRCAPPAICCCIRSSADASKRACCSRFAREGLDDPDAGQVLLQDGVQRRELDLHLR